MAQSLWQKFWDTTHHAAHWLMQEGAETLYSATRWLEDHSFSCIKCRTKVRGSTMHCPTCGTRFVPEEVAVKTRRRLTGLLGNISRQNPVRYLTDLLEPDHPVTHRVLKSFIVIAAESEGHSLFMLFNVTIFSLVTPGTAAIIPLLAYLLYHHRSLFEERSLRPLRTYLQNLKKSLAEKRITKAQYYRKRDRWIEAYLNTVFSRQAKKKKSGIDEAKNDGNAA
jgi:hypothetical protein